MTGTGANSVAVSFMTKTSQPISPSAPFVEIVGTDTLVITRVQLVFAKIELARGGNEDCIDDEQQSSDCDALHADPALVELPVNGSLKRLFIADVPPGSYEFLQAKVHFVAGGGNSPAAAFLAAHPDLAGVSVRVYGTFDHAPFTYTSGAEANISAEFSPPIEVGKKGLNLTVRVDIGSWFLDRSDILIDPRTALPGGPNDNLVDQNIHHSFQAFEDDDEDGSEDAH
jgi:hypothetical protein